MFDIPRTKIGIEQTPCIAERQKKLNYVLKKAAEKSLDCFFVKGLLNFIVPDFWNARACGAFGMKNQESVPFVP